MASTQLARGIWTGFAPTEDPFQAPNGMSENLRLIDDHLALYTLAAPVPATTALPTDVRPGAGQIFGNGSYAVFNAGSWTAYPARTGMWAIELGPKTQYVNIGTGWQVITAGAAKKTYLTRALMDADAGNPVGTQGVVTNDPGHTAQTPINGEYTYTSGGWVRNAFQPANQADVDGLSAILAQLQTDFRARIRVGNAPDRAFDFVDACNFIIATLFTNGVFGTGALQLRGADNPIRGGRNGLVLRDPNGFVPIRLDVSESWLYGLKVTPTLDGRIAILDRNRFALLYIGPEGCWGLRQQAPQAPTPPAAGRPQLDLGRQLRTDVMHVLIYGQSLSRGEKAMPPISLSQPYGNLMLAGGSKARPGDAAYNPSAFVPLVENTVGVEGETPVSGCLNAIVRRAVTAGSSADRWIFLGSSSGQSGRTVEQLAPGGASGRYEQTLQIIRDAKALCDAQSRGYSVWAMCWYQGEQDYRAETSNDGWPYDYTERWLTTLWQRQTRDVAEITGQQFAPYLITYQVAAHRRYSRDDMPIALAQWRVSRAYDDVILAAPAYIFETDSDYLHLTATGSWLMGEYTARALYQTMIRRSGKWRPLEPVSVDWQAIQIRVKYHVPAGQLVIDSALCAAYENAGFILRDGNDAVITGGITGVAVTGYDEITITTAPDIPADAKLTYARGKPGDSARSGPVYGARGNVHDTAGLHDQVTSPLGTTHALHNACVMFEYSRAIGF